MKTVLAMAFLALSGNSVIAEEIYNGPLNCNYVRFILKRDYGPGGYLNSAFGHDLERAYNGIRKWGGVKCNEPYRQPAAQQPARSTPRVPKQRAEPSPTRPKPAETSPSTEDQKRIAQQVVELRKYWADDNSLNPWKQASAKTEKPVDGRAPYAPSSCVEFRRIGSGITADNVGIFNKCSFPIQVLHCFHTPGQVSKCPVRGSGSWAISSTIDPGNSSIGIAPMPTWDVAYYVCNMAGVQNYSQLCLRPK
jgi:hypothetical protein